MIGRSAFDDAKRRMKISFNVFENIEAKEYAARTSSTQTLTEDQAVKLLTSINGDLLSPLFTLTLVTGMRLGEVLGLTWDRVDLEQGKIEVRQGLQWLLNEHANVDGRPHPEMLRAIPYKAARDGATKPYLFTPKSQNSSRDIYLDERLVNILKAHRVKQTERFGIKSNGLVFVTDQNTPYRPENIERALTEYAHKANLPEGITPKSLRHSQSNFQRAMGIEAVTRAASLGHSSAVNLVTYSHASETELRKAAELSARLIPA
jgi:integrase